MNHIQPTLMLSGLKQQNPLSGSVTVFNYIFYIFNKRKKSNLNSASPFLYMIRNRCCSKSKKSTAQMFKIAKKSSGIEISIGENRNFAVLTVTVYLLTYYFGAVCWRSSQ